MENRLFFQISLKFEVTKIIIKNCDSMLICIKFQLEKIMRNIVFSFKAWVSHFL